jgi:methyltransferase-like protein
MKIKIVVSLSIFSLLFSAALLLHLQLQNNREINVNNMESHINNLNAVPINNENTQLNTISNSEISNVQWKLFEPFKPREYVRIIGS